MARAILEIKKDIGGVAILVMTLKSHFREKVGFVRVDFTSMVRVFVAKGAAFVTLEKKEEWVAKWMKVWKK